MYYMFQMSLSNFDASCLKFNIWSIRKSIVDFNRNKI